MAAVCDRTGIIECPEVYTIRQYHDLVKGAEDIVCPRYGNRYRAGRSAAHFRTGLYRRKRAHRPSGERDRSLSVPTDLQNLGHTIAAVAHEDGTELQIDLQSERLEIE